MQHIRTSADWSSSMKILLIAVSLGLAVSGCSPQKQAVNTASAVNVGTQAATLGDVSQTIAVTGALASLNDVPLSAKQGGRLASLVFHNGDKVNAGDVVARIDATDLISAVKEDEAAVASSRASLENARAAYQKQITSTRTGIDSARAAYSQQVAQSSSEVESAKAALESAQANLSEVNEGDRQEDRVKTEATLESAQANCKKAQADLKRYQKLHNAGVISDEDLDKYQNTLDTAIATLKSDEASTALQEHGNRRQDIEQAKKKVQQAEETLRQSVAARATDAVKRADLETALAGVADNKVKWAQVKSAEATLQQSLATLDVAKQAVKDAVVVSPISGYAYSRSAEPGQIVSAGTTLVHIVSLNTVYYEPSIPNIQMGGVHLGQKVQVNVDSLPGKTFTGLVIRIYPQSSSTDRSVSLRVSISNEKGLLRPGNYATGIITTGIHRNVVIVPSVSVLDEVDGTGSYVYIVENAIAKKVKVTKGFISDKQGVVEVKEIKAGAQVIVNGLSNLADGQKVTAYTASTDIVR